MVTNISREFQTFDSSGVELAYSDRVLEPQEGGLGKGEPILLIHGFASNMFTNWEATGWNRFLLKAGYRVINIDNRGHGQSEKLYGDEDYGAPLMAEDAVRLLDHLGIGKAHVMGYSMGARICGFISFNHPSRVSSTVFGGMGYNMVRGIGASGPIAKGLLEPNVTDIKNDTVKTFRLFAESTGSDLKALAACIRSARTPITEQQLETIRTPVLVAVGTKDVIAGDAQRLAGLMPGAKVLPIVDKDHMKAVGDPGFKQGVLAFLSGQ